MKSCKNLIFFLVSFMLSCESNKEKITRALTDNNFKYWQRVDTNIRDRVKYFEYFDKNGKYLFFHKVKDRNFEKSDFGDIVPIKTWRYLDNLTILSGGDTCKIIKLNCKEMILKCKFNGTAKYIIAPKGSVPLNFNRLQ